MSDSMKTIARFITRPNSPKKDAQVDLIVGACFSSQTDLKPGKVYEIREIMGELQIVEVGDSVVSFKKKDNITGCNWYWSIHDIMAHLGKYLWLTRKEYQQ